MEYIIQFFKENPIINSIFQLELWFFGKVIKTLKIASKFQFHLIFCWWRANVQFWRQKVRKSANFCTPYNLHTHIIIPPHTRIIAVPAYISDMAYNWELRDPGGFIDSNSRGTRPS